MGLGTVFSGVAFLMLAVIRGCSGASVIGFWRWISTRLWNRGGVEHTPLGRRDSIPRRGPPARQDARPSELSEWQVRLLRRFSAALCRLLCTSHVGFFPPHKGTVFRCVVYIASTALKLFPLGRASTEDVGVLTRDASCWVAAVMLRVSKGLGKLEL